VEKLIGEKDRGFDIREFGNEIGRKVDLLWRVHRVCATHYVRNKRFRPRFGEFLEGHVRTTVETVVV
jgi:hypothetical protein